VRAADVIDRPPRQVAYVLSLFPSLSETFILREILALRRRGVGVLVFSLKPPSEPIMHEEARLLLKDTVYPRSFAGLLAAATRAKGRWAGLLTEALREASGAGPVEWGKAAYTVLVAAHFAEVARQRGVYHFHAHWTTYPALAARAMASLTGLPYSVTTHAFDIFLPNSHRAENLRRASHVVTISEFNQRYLATHGLAREIAVIPCGLDLSQFVPAARDRRGCPTITAVGRLDPIKGFSVLIDACALLAQRDVQFTCEIIGDGPQRSELTARIARHALQDRVRLLGALEQREVRKRVNQACVFALPCVTLPNGDQDGIPVALMEAMALRVPIVTTPVSGIPELVTNGVSGLLVPSADPVALANAILRVLTDDDLADRLASAGRRVVEDRYDVNTAVAALASLLRLKDDGGIKPSSTAGEVVSRDRETHA
jgi:glycosyltransferase involved in cell wall biosynthesis